MPADSNVRPGGPARQFHFIPVVTQGGGVLDEDTSLVSDPNKITPLKSFSYILEGGNSSPFYKGFPRIVSATDKAALIAAGLVV
jgi:hypothetical protein